FFPLSYVLDTNGTRQFVVRERVPDNVLDLASAAGGTHYYLGNTEVAQITADGLLSAAQDGFTQVSIVQGGQSVIVPITIEPVTAGPKVIGDDGGLVSDGNGAVVGIPAGALSGDRTVTVETLDSNDLPYNLPDGWNTYSGVKVEWGGEGAEHPFSVELDAPADKQPGDIVYLFQPISVRLESGEIEQSWLVVDSMVVGTDGKMRTTSPPNMGLASRLYNKDLPRALFNPSAAGILFASSPNLMTFFAARTDEKLREKTLNGSISPGVVSAEIAPGGGDPEQRFYVMAGPLGDFLSPAVANFNYKLTVHSAQPTGLVKLEETEVLARPGTISEFALPLAPRFVVQNLPQPTITSAVLEFGNPADPRPTLKLSGGNFTLASPYNDPFALGATVKDLYVTFVVGDPDTVDVNGVHVLGGRDVVVPGSELSVDAENRLSVPVPANALVGVSRVMVTRPMNVPLDGKLGRQIFPSNPIQILPTGRYAFVANGGADSVSAIDLLHTEPAPAGATSELQQVPVEAARIPLGVGLDEGTLGPRKMAVTPDATRAYVTLESGAGVAIIDTVALHEVDAVPDIPVRENETPAQTAEREAAEGVQHIMLPAQARPYDLVVDHAGKYLYVSDYNSAIIYVIDVDPTSAKFHQHVQSINLTQTSAGEDLAPLGLRGLDIAPDDSKLVVAAPAQDLFGTYRGKHGHLITVNLTNTSLRQAGDGPNAPTVSVAGDLGIVFDPSAPGAVVTVGPGPFDVSATDDPNVFLWVDRVDDSQGFGTLKFREFKDAASGESIVLTELETINLLPFGMIPRLVEGRGTQVFGVSNAQGVTFVPANTYEDVIGPHPSYAFITGYNKLVTQDPKHDPALAPFLAYNPTYHVEVTYQERYMVRPGNPPEYGYRDVTTSIPFPAVPLGAGGNVGVIRSVMGDLEPGADSIDDPEIYRPRIVSATTPIMNGFPDDIAFSKQGQAVVAPFQAINSVFAYSVPQMLSVIEGEVKQATTDGVLASWAQLSEGQVVPDSLSHLLRGELSTIPIDSIYRSIALAGDYRFYNTTDNRGREIKGYGVPTQGPSGETPNLSAPVEVGRLPRGVAVQPGFEGDVVTLQLTPYNQAPSLTKFPDDALTVDAGTDAVVEVHTGALQQDHQLVGYHSQNADRVLTLHYDSLRAEAKPIYYFDATNLSQLSVTGDSARFIASLTARMGDTSYELPGLPAGAATEAMGLKPGQNLFKLPERISADETYGIGMQIDLTEADSGLYTFELDYGVKKVVNGKYSGGKMLTQSNPVAFVNTKDSIFGAGWGLDGYFEIYPGDGGIVLVDGNGNEQIYLAPDRKDDPFTSLSVDFSELRQLDNGRFVRRMVDGTVYAFNDNNQLETITDRNGNITRFGYVGRKLANITDPVGLRTIFGYQGDRVNRITDPAGRVTELSYDRQGNLISIKDPDSIARTFRYADAAHPNLMTGETGKRGNDPKDPLTGGTNFQEKFIYDDYGRIKAGTRLDDLNFTLRPSQTYAVADLKLTTSPDEAPRLSPLTRLGEYEAIENRFQCPGEVSSGSSGGRQQILLAQANYTNFHGEEYKFKMTGYGQLISTKDAKDNYREFAKNSAGGQITTAIDEMNNAICYSYDTYGNVASITDYPDGPGQTRAVTKTFEYSFSEFNQLKKMVDEVGRVTEMVLDGNGNLRKKTVTDPSPVEGQPSTTSMEITYQTGGLVATTKDGRGNVIANHYDSYGRLDKVTYTDGEEKYEYNDLTGNVSAFVTLNKNRIE
ncbi:MAG: hypothetical protein KDA92_14545, partial [Planctomycetales bacterium]|nr:hypothetical protein [Planctomycetales bacterium]